MKYVVGYLKKKDQCKFKYSLANIFFLKQNSAGLSTVYIYILKNLDMA
jgi:hypothetical protein